MSAHEHACDRGLSDKAKEVQKKYEMKLKRMNVEKEKLATIKRKNKERNRLCDKLTSIQKDMVVAEEYWNLRTDYLETRKALNRFLTENRGRDWRKMTGFNNPRSEPALTSENPSVFIKKRNTEIARIKAEIKAVEDDLDRILNEAGDDDENSGLCEICWEEYDQKDHWYSCLTTCGHRYGFTCIEKQFDINQRCPKCD